MTRQELIVFLNELFHNTNITHTPTLIKVPLFVNSDCQMTLELHKDPQTDKYILMVLWGDTLVLCDQNIGYLENMYRTKITAILIQQISTASDVVKTTQQQLNALKHTIESKAHQ